MQKKARGITRRELVKKTTPLLLALKTLSQQTLANPNYELPPVRTLTHGPKYHWFGYYDKLQFNPSGQFVLGMEVDFEHRSPEPNDVIKIGMVDLQDGDKWIELGETRTWCWQQGCMLQWRPGSNTEILWNDRHKDRFVCRILDVETRNLRTIPHPIYTVSPDGRWAVAPDFRRLSDMRSAYGYPGLDDPHSHILAPKDSGIFRVDLETGNQELLITLDEVAQIPMPNVDLAKAKSYFNHLLISPDSTRLIFLHRWGFPKFVGATRMFTANQNGSDLRVIDPSGHTSHFIWRDPEHILAWTKPEGKPWGFYLYQDKENGTVEIVGEGVMKENGHCTYLPGGNWILNDTYPDQERDQDVYLYHIGTKRRVPLGRFFSPPEYTREGRVDTHPRFSPNGQSVVIDSPHTGEGRQLHLIDLRGIIDMGTYT